MIKRAALPQLMLVSALSLGIAACSSDDNDNPPAGESGQTSELAPDEGGGEGEGGGTIAPVVSNAFDGTWLQSCALEDEEFPEEGYDVTMVVINGATAMARSTGYTDSACASPDEFGEITSEASLVFPGGTTTTPQGVATHVDVTTETFLINGQPPSPDNLALLQTIGAFDPLFDIALIDDNGVLFFGDIDGENNGDSAEMRPTTLETRGFVRQ